MIFACLFCCIVWVCVWFIYLKEAIHSWDSIFKRYKVLHNKNTCFSCSAVTNSHPQGSHPCFLLIFLEICIHSQAQVFTLTFIFVATNEAYWTHCVCFFHLYMHLGHGPISTVLEKATHTYHVLKNIYIIFQYMAVLRVFKPLTYLLPFT